MSEDEKTVKALADVLVRYREHLRYGTRDKALKAFARRCPAVSRADRESMFDFYDSLLLATVRAGESRLTRNAFKEADGKEWSFALQAFHRSYAGFGLTNNHQAASTTVS